MNRSQLVEEIASTTGLTKRQAEEAVDSFVVTIGDQVRSGSKVTIYGFGSFNPTSRKARTGRNPRTGQPVKIAASKGIRFSPATGFKADLNTKKSAAKKTAAAKASAGRASATKAPKQPRQPRRPRPRAPRGLDAKWLPLQRAPHHGRRAGPPKPQPRRLQPGRPRPRRPQQRRHRPRRPLRGSLRPARLPQSRHGRLRGSKRT